MSTTTAPVPADGQTVAVQPQPFVRGAYEHVEPMPLDVTTTLGNQTLLGLFDVPAFGFLRSILLLVQATGGTGAAAVYKEDAPWSVLQEVLLSDVNGAPLVGPYSGYELYLIGKFGGYVGASDPTRSPYYSAPSTAGNFSFLVRLPVEISGRDALGALPNQNASQTYKLRVTQAATADVMSTPSTTLPSVRVRGYIEAWSQPMPTDLLGRPVAATPPAMGTTQFWTKQVFNNAQGFATNRLARVGNLTRNIILVYRVSGARSTTAFPDPISFYLDSKLLTNQPRLLQQHYMAERNVGSTIDTGVAVFDFCHDFDGFVGSEMRDQLLPTTQATRLEFQGDWSSAGTLTVLTNDIAPAGDIYL